MKKITIFLATCLLTIGLASAQQTMSVTNGSFENWTISQGDSGAVMGTPLYPLYDSYITPTNWHTMTYRIDTTFPMDLFSAHTDVPLQIMFKDSTGVPDGRYAAVLQTFQITDVLTGIASVPGGTSLLNGFDTVVMPTILSLGELNLNTVPGLIAILPNLMSDPSALAMLDTLDFNNYSTGGMDLNGFNLGKLTGKYKYEPYNENSAEVGGVILIGTVNDTATGKRKIVGGGMNTNLTHVHAYTDFEVLYMSLSNDSTVIPEKLEVVLLSSAGSVINRGSRLFIDDLKLSEERSSDTSVVGIAIATGEPSFSIYPNPTKGNIYLDLNSNEKVNVRIFNQLGQTVARRNDCIGKVVFNLPTAGLYVMEVSNNNFRSVKQVVVTK